MFLCLVENHTKGYNFSKAYKYDNLPSSKQNDRDRDIVQQLRGKRLLGQTLPTRLSLQQSYFVKLSLM